jgi:hypothetical protein
MLDFMKGQGRPVPTWLKRITKNDVYQGPARWMKRFLSEAIVYPGSGTDVSPMRQMEGIAHAFLFLDLSIRLDQIREVIRGGFKDQDGDPTCRLVLGRFPETPAPCLPELTHPDPAHQM